MRDKVNFALKREKDEKMMIMKLKNKTERFSKKKPRVRRIGITGGNQKINFKDVETREVFLAWNLEVFPIL